MSWLYIFAISLFLQNCTALGTQKIEGSGVCGCEFTCQAFRGSGATTCYLIYQEDGMWRSEEHSLLHEEFLDQRQCATGMRQHCYMFAVYPSYLQLSCLDAHNVCQRASGGIAKMDTNHELYEFSVFLASNIMKDYQHYYYKTIAADLWHYNSLIKNTCADVQSVTAYGSNIQSTNCQERFKPVNSILCENAPLPINSYCSSTQTTLSPGQDTAQPKQPTTPIIKKATRPLPTSATILPNNPVPRFPGYGFPNVPPTWWPREITKPTTLLTKKFKKKKKMVMNNDEPHENKKKTNNVTHIVTGIFFVGTIVMVGFAFLVGCFFRRRHDNQAEIYRWTNAAEPDKLQVYAEVDRKNAATDHEDGYSVINAVEKRQNKRVDSVNQRLSKEDCRRYRMSKALSADFKYKNKCSQELQQDVDVLDASTYKTRVRRYDLDQTSSSISVTTSRSSAHYEIRDFMDYDYAYSSRHLLKNQYSDPYAHGIQDPAYDYAYTHSNLKKTQKMKPQHKQENKNRVHSKF